MRFGSIPSLHSPSLHSPSLHSPSLHPETPVALTDDLQRLAEMHARDELTDEEYTAAKKRLLHRGTQSKSSGLIIALVAGVGLVFLVIPIIGILAAIAIPNFVKMQYRAKRAELPSNVDGIKTAELAYDAEFDQFVAVSAPHPRAIEALSKAQAPWGPGSAFETLAWYPDEMVRGTYWVEVSDTDFVVHGVADIDGDGVLSHYTATRTVNATMVSGMRDY